MEDDELELDHSFSQLIREQEIDLGLVNYGSTDDNENAINQGRADVIEKPSHQPPKKSVSVEEIQMDVLGKDDSHAREETTLVRRRIKSVKESSKGIENILEDMPSRTVGRKRGLRLASGANTIHKFGSMYRHNRLASVNQDDIDAAELFEEMVTENGDIDNNDLRELPVNMTLKRRVRNKAKEKAEKAQSESIGWFSLWRFRMSLRWRHFKDDFYKLISSGKLWNHHLKLVEGYFGTGVLSYFTFLRGIFFLSLPSFLLSFLFISVPQLVEQPSLPQCKFTGEGFLTGANCLTDTIMYQGYYTNASINNIGNTYYNMPLAYLFATFGYFLLCLIWLVRVTGILFRENYIDAKEDSSNFISKVFCAWDFGTTSEHTALLRHKMITTELKEILADQRRGEDHRTSCEKFELYLMRLVSWLFYLAIVAGAAALVYFTNKTFICEIKSYTQNNPIFQDLALPLIISTMNLILPYVIDLLTHFEKYKYRRHELYISVVRNFLFKMSILGVICAFWTSNNVESCSQSMNETAVCWETELGQEIYRLAIVDFIFSMVFSTFCAEFLRNVFAKLTGHKSPEFTISNNVMDLIYGQTLCWIGVYFSPMLSLINMIKYFLLFYVKKVSVMNNCSPATERWRATQSETLFNTMQLLSFLLSSAFLGYVIFNETPSESCGPFRGQSRAYDIVVEMIDELSSTETGEWFAVVLRIITNIWVIDAILIAILVMVIFARNRSKGLQILANTLTEQIALEGKDKSLLLKWLQTMSNRCDVHGFSDGAAPGPSNRKPEAGDILLTSGVYVDKTLDRIEDEDDSAFSPPN